MEAITCAANNDGARAQALLEKAAKNNRSLPPSEVMLARLLLKLGQPAPALAQLEKAGIPAGPVLHYDEVFTNPHVLARGMVEQTQHPVTGRFGTLGVTVKLSETPGTVRRPAPRLDEHGKEVLSRRAAAE